MSAWLSLLLAIGCEIFGTLFLKLSNGFEKWPFGVASITCFCACFVFLAPAMKEIPVGIVYAIWAGVGIVAATIMGILFFSEQLSLAQSVFIGLILVGTIGLKLNTGV